MFEFDRSISSAVLVDDKHPAPAHDREPVQGPLSPELLDKMQRYWQAANYLTIGQIYLQDNPLLREPLRPEHIKPRLLGHWGTSPGLSFIYVHLNRLINEHDANVIYLAGPGHGGPALVANVYLEGTYSEIYPEISQDVEGMRRLFRQFSTPGGIPSHVSVPTPGSIHEGGELGYVLTHAFGAAFDNPDLIVAAVVGDGEAETGPLAGSWQGHQLPQPGARWRGAADPAPQRLQDRRPDRAWPLERRRCARIFEGNGYEVHFVEGDDPDAVHQAVRRHARHLLRADPRHPERRAAANGVAGAARAGRRSSCARPKAGPAPRWSTACPSRARSARTRCRSTTCKNDPEHLAAARGVDAQLPARTNSSTEQGKLIPELAALAPKGDRRMGANPHANGGKLLRRPGPARLPRLRDRRRSARRPSTPSPPASSAS